MAKRHPLLRGLGILFLSVVVFFVAVFFYAYFTGGEVRVLSLLGGEGVGVLLIEGTMRFTIDAIDYDLEEGDSIHFRTAYPHSWANPSDRPARAIWLAIRSS